MFWYLEATSMPIHIDAQKNPIPPVLIFIAACLVLWFVTGLARRRDERRARVRDLSQWTNGRSRRPPRY